MTMIEAIMIRKSCRTYSGRKIDQETLDELKDFLEYNKESPFGSPLRFQLLDFSELQAVELKKVTTYGVIKGARQFIVGAVKNRMKAMEDFGYVMEKNILKATSLGLGTCILGGTFRRSGFTDKIGVTENEVVPVISPVGHPRSGRSIVDRMFRLIATSDRRKPWNELFYYDNGDPIFPDNQELEKYRTPLECVRLAPSASNKQPWRVVLRGDRKDSFHFYLKRTTGYERLFKDINLQNVDMGIALCHFELSAEELGLVGGWGVENPQVQRDGWEYVATWA